MRLLIIVLTLLPTLAFAEGGERILACRTVTACDVNGHCTAQDVQTVFRVQPVKVDADGAGQWLLSYDDVSAPVTLEAGDMRLSWSEGSEDAQT